jgi:hypothetical protein
LSEHYEDKFKQLQNETCLALASLGKANNALDDMTEERNELERLNLLHENGALVKALKDELASTQKDAERYRWLRDDDNWGDDADNRWEVLGEKSCKDFDEIIDAAIEGSKP